MRTLRVMARTSISLFRFSLRRVSAMLLEHSRRRELAQTVADHVFGHEHRIEHLSVVHVERKTDEIRRDHRATRPGLDRRFGLRFFRLDDLVHQMIVNKRTFFYRASHRDYFCFTGRPSRRTNMNRIECFFLWRAFFPFDSLPHRAADLLQPAPPLALPRTPPLPGFPAVPRTPPRIPRPPPY